MKKLSLLIQLITVFFQGWYENSRIGVRFKRSCLKRDSITFTPWNVVNLLMVYEWDGWSKYLNAELTLKLS